MRRLIPLMFVAAFLAAAACAATPQTIVLNNLAHSQSQLFIAGSNGSAERPLLATPVFEYDPAWSPDGQWITFTSERTGSANLYRVKPDGSALQQLTDNRAFNDQAAFSPDSQRLVFVSTLTAGRANLWILDLASHATRPLTSGPGGDFRPAWSADGQWIAFSSDRGNTLPMARNAFEHLQIADLYLIHPDGSGLKRLTERVGFCGSPKWTRDSHHLIAYCMSAEETFTYRRFTPADGLTRLVSIDIDTGKLENLPAPSGVKIAPAVLASGKIAYVLKGSQAPGIVYANGQRGPGGPVRTASWSPTDQEVVYDKVARSEFPDWQKTGSREPGYELILTHAMPAFDPTGSRLVATGGKTVQDGQNTDLLLIDARTHQGKVIFHDAEGRSAFGAQWSPAGEEIVFGLGRFFTLRHRGAYIATIHPDGSGFRKLTSGVNNDGFPSFSPDGQRIVYRTFGTQEQGLRILDLQTLQVTKLTGDYDNQPLWSPRGDRISFMRRYLGDFEMFSIRPDGKNLRRLTSSRGNDAQGAWSPDGNWLLFLSARMGFKDEALYSDTPQPYGELFVMRYDGTHVRQLTDNRWEEGFPSWQPPVKQSLPPAAAALRFR